MENANKITPRSNINLKIKDDSVLFFDMDGTLVDTNFANFLSYKMAIQTVVQSNIDISFDPCERFNRASIKRIIPNLSETDYNKIIQLKEENYKDNLSKTLINKTVVDILVRYSQTNKTVLVTNCRQDRALITLDYHNLIDKFDVLFFRQTPDKENRSNKFKYAISHLGLQAQTIIIFENEKQEIDDALSSGILIDNILKI